MEDDLENERIGCGRHGASAPPTFACVHLVEGAGLGVCFDDEAEEPWPDAVCSVCDQEPEWTDEQALARIRVLCKYCWEECYGRNTRVEARSDEEIADEIHRARHRAADRQNEWLERFEVGTHPHYEMRLEDDVPWLGFGEDAKRIHLRCDALVIGSWGRRSGTWLWGWANSNWEPHLTRPFVAVKRYGEKQGLTPLWRASTEADEDECFALAASAFDRIRDVEGMYRVPTDNGSLFLAVRETRYVS